MSVETAREAWRPSESAGRAAHPKRLPVSYWRTDLEMTRSQESRTAAGPPVGTRAVSGPFRLRLER
jgi:hypothetical protein